MKTKLTHLALFGASLITANGEKVRSLQDMAAATAWTIGDPPAAGR